MGIRFADATKLGATEPRDLLDLGARFPHTRLVTDVLFDETGELEGGVEMPELCRDVASLMVASSTINFTDINLIHFNSMPVQPGKSQHVSAGQHDPYLLWHSDAGVYAVACSSLPLETIVGKYRPQIRDHRLLSPFQQRPNIERRLNEGVDPNSVGLTIRPTEANYINLLTSLVTHRACRNPHRIALARIFAAVGLDYHY